MFWKLYGTIIQACIIIIICFFFCSDSHAQFY